MVFLLAVYHAETGGGQGSCSSHQTPDKGEGGVRDLERGPKDDASVKLTAGGETHSLNNKKRRDLPFPKLGAAQ